MERDDTCVRGGGDLVARFTGRIDGGELSSMEGVLLRSSSEDRQRLRAHSRLFGRSPAHALVEARAAVDELWIGAVITRDGEAQAWVRRMAAEKAREAIYAALELAAFEDDEATVRAAHTLLEEVKAVEEEHRRMRERDASFLRSREGSASDRGMGAPRPDRSTFRIMSRSQVRAPARAAAAVEAVQATAPAAVDAVAEAVVARLRQLGLVAPAPAPVGVAEPAAGRAGLTRAALLDALLLSASSFDRLRREAGVAASAVGDRARVYTAEDLGLLARAALKRPKGAALSNAILKVARGLRAGG